MVLNLRNFRCDHCRSSCFIGTANHYEHACCACFSRALPFSKLSNNELLFLFKDSFQEVIRNFQNMDFENAEIIDNVETCRYLELEDVKNISQPSVYFSLIHVNIVSLNKNIDKIRSLLYSMDNNPDIIGVSETRINDDNRLLSECELSGYDFIYDNSPTNGRPGGAGFFIKNDIDYTIRNDLKLSSPDCENVWIETNINGKKKYMRCTLSSSTA